jgi:hypothetical protein
MRPRRFGSPNDRAESSGVGVLRGCVLVTGADRVSEFLKRSRTIKIGVSLLRGHQATRRGFESKEGDQVRPLVPITGLGVHRASAVWCASHSKATIRIRISAEGDTATARRTE